MGMNQDGERETLFLINLLTILPLKLCVYINFNTYAF